MEKEPNSFDSQEKPITPDSPTFSNEEKENLIRGAQNFEELYQVLEQIGFLAGSGDDFESYELIDMIEKVRKGELDTDFITRAGGLREKVEELMRMENSEEEENIEN